MRGMRTKTGWSSCFRRVDCMPIGWLVGFSQIKDFRVIPILMFLHPGCASPGTSLLPQMRCIMHAKPQRIEVAVNNGLFPGGFPHFFARVFPFNHKMRCQSPPNISSTAFEGRVSPAETFSSFPRIKPLKSYSHLDPNLPSSSKNNHVTMAAASIPCK